MYKFLKKMLGIQQQSGGDAAGDCRANTTVSIKKVVVPRAEHPVTRANISESALKVMYRLNKAGYEAYLVGGGVRDLLLGREPKDFDVATDATPDQVKALFRNCRLVGRRFRLAHILFGRETIEVATFRGSADTSGAGGVVEEGGRILRDNVYGTLEEDAVRRDFTVNALYYNIADFSLVDFAGGMQDMEAGVLRLIGDAEQRYREDPVRMLRAVRFAAKIGFRIHPDSEAPIFDLGHLLQDIPAARLFDETLKLFMGGCAVQTFELLRHYDLFQYLFPETDKALAEEEEHFPNTLVIKGLANTDERVQAGKPVTPAFLYGVLLWPAMKAEMEACLAAGEEQQAAFSQAARKVVESQVRCTSLPRRFSTPMQEIWVMQFRLPRRGGRRAWRLLEHNRFRAAYDFLELRAYAGEVEQALVDWWTEFQEVDEARQREMVKALGPAAGKGRRGRRRRRRSSAKRSGDSGSATD